MKDDDETAKKQIAKLPKRWKVGFAIHCARIVLDEILAKKLPPFPHAEFTPLTNKLGEIETECATFPLSPPKLDRLEKIRHEFDGGPRELIGVSQTMQAAIMSACSFEKGTDEDQTNAAFSAYSDGKSATRDASFGVQRFTSLALADLEAAIEHTSKDDNRKDNFPQRFFAAQRAERK